MDRNKDEAIRARELSKTKMSTNDFEGARVLVLKAQTLYPELEDIGRLRSICDVHCSAQKKINESQKDWYAVLQVDRLADVPTIKKQYRRLALILHPDKNRLPGAEEAFKLIGDANAVLSDISKKSSYDNNFRPPATATQPPHTKRNYNANKRFYTQNNPANGFGNLNHQQVARSGSSFQLEVFAASCPFCMTTYGYAREHVNKLVRCKCCQKQFMACETGVGVVPAGSNVDQMPSKPGFSQPGTFHTKVVPNKGHSKVDIQNAKASSTSRAGVQGNAGMETSQQETKTNGLHTNYKRSGNESANLKNKSGKKARKLVEESSESVDSSDDDSVESESDPELDSVDDTYGKRYECPDADFHDFNKHRDANLFKAGQIWACYGDLDSMPKFYAKLTKASSFPFEVSYKWLESVPISEYFEGINDLAVGCGNYKVGTKVHQSRQLFIFSHQMVNFLPVRRKGSSLILYPKKGQIWAIIKDWDKTWLSSPENHQELNYEIVEVLSEFDDGAGFTVRYMDKVAGFVSLFQSSNKNNSNTFRIRPDELYKFSHLVLSSKMSGSEREGVPRGSYELDPAALPVNPDQLYFPSRVNKEHEIMDSEVHCPPSKSVVDEKSKSEKIKSTSSQIDFVDLVDSD